MIEFIKKNIKDLGENAMWLGIAVVFIAGVLGVAHSCYTGKDDQPIEEFCEEIIENQTGWVDIDLTPFSPEE